MLPIVFTNYCKKDRHILKDCPTRPSKKSATALTIFVGTLILNPSASNQPLTPEMVQQMIILASSALGISSKKISISPLWYFDSGASNHMTNNPHLLTNSTKYSGNVMIHTDENHLSITNIGDISSSLTDVFVSLGLTTNLISIGQLVDNNCHVEFSHSGCLVQDQRSGKMIAKGPKVGRLFPLHLPLSSIHSLPFISCNFL